MPLRNNQVLQNRYRIENLLGQGGYGAVYQAWDLHLQQYCALKENLRTDIGTQFETETRILQDLKHIHLPRVYDFFAIPGQGQYLVMDYIEGKDLQSVLDQSVEPLPVRDVLVWVGQICDALNYLHSQPVPVIHRDINPKNIIINSEGSAILVDFGIAKFHMQGKKTTQGARAVTPGFSPPEQYGYGSTDARSDIYSLAATMYVLLTKKEFPESVLRISDPDVEPLSARSVNPRVPKTVSDAIVIATQVEQNQRFGTVREFANALHTPSTRRITGKRNGLQFLLPRLIPTILILVLIAGLAGMGIAMSYLQRSPTPPATVVVITRVSGVTVIAPATQNTIATDVPSTTPSSEPSVVTQLTGSTTPSSTPKTGPTVFAQITELTVNARMGPSKQYPIMAYLKKDALIYPTGRNSDGTWLTIQLADGRQAWVSATVIKVTGEIFDLAVISSPPLPTPEASWTARPAQGPGTGPGPTSYPYP